MTLSIETNLSFRTASVTFFSSLLSVDMLATVLFRSWSAVQSISANVFATPKIQSTKNVNSKLNNRPNGSDQFKLLISMCFLV